MKTFFLTSILAATLLTASGVTAYAADTDAPKTEKQADNTGGATIKFAEKEYNFGIVPINGGGVSHSFEFTNTGDAPLVIISATASCGCTRPTYPTEPIAPGKKGKIKVTYLPEGRPGEFNRVVKVRTNDKNAKKISLVIKGTVKPD